MRVAWALLSAAVAGVSSAAADWPDWAAEALAASCLECYAKSEAVVILEEWDIHLRQGERRGSLRRLVHVLSDDGLAEAEIVLVSGPFRDHDKARVWVRHPGGDVLRFSEEDGTLFGVGKTRMLDDVRVLRIEPPGLVPGSTIAVESTFVHSAEWPQDLFRLQRRVPISRIVISVDARSGWTVDARVVGANLDGPSRTNELARWEFTSLPALPQSWRGLAPVPPSATLALNYSPPETRSPFESWHSSSDWFREKFRLPPGDLPQEVLQAVAASDDPVDTAGRIARRLRYFAVELGWGTIVPRAPSTTLAREFGDCKDKAQVMLALLRSVGIEAYPVLAVAPSDSYVPDDLPSPGLFNHVVVGIPWTDRERRPGMAIIEDSPVGPLRVFDATNLEGSDVDIPPTLEGGAGLVLDPRTRGIVRFPRSGAGDNVMHRATHLSIENDGTVGVHQVVRASGSLRQLLEGDSGSAMAAAELRREVYPEIAGHDPDLRGLEIGPVRRDHDGAWSYEVRYTSPNFLAKFGNLRLLEPGMLSPLSVMPVAGPPGDVIFVPLQFTFSDSWELRHDGWERVLLGEPFSLRNTIGSVVLEVESVNETTRIRRSVTVAASEVTGDRIEEIAELRAGLRRVNGIALVLERVE